MRFITTTGSFSKLILFNSLIIKIIVWNNLNYDIYIYIVKILSFYLCIFIWHGHEFCFFLSTSWFFQCKIKAIKIPIPWELKWFKFKRKKMYSLYLFIHFLILMNNVGFFKNQKFGSSYKNLSQSIKKFSTKKKQYLDYSYVTL